MQRRLRATKGPLCGALYVLSRRRTTIGRGGDVDIQVLSKGVSRLHCVLEVDDASHKVCLNDEGSTNGTFVRDRKIRRHELKPGDSFRLGEAVFLYEEDEEGLIEGPPTEELDIKVASGPAMAGTISYMANSPDGCGHPLHALAKESGWKHCPNCGGPTSDE